MQSEKKRKILAIEDDPTYIRLLKTCLEAKGYTVVFVTDGLQALNMVRQVKPDLIITDLMLPGMDGHKFCRMIKFDKNTGKIPIIMLTARDLDKEEEMSKKVGADMFLSKTQPIQELLKVIPKLLEQADKANEKAI
ncbi:response regulator [candidate division KSB1 bacterium]|nr:response regulator [candidate division KSB1 bacterium]